MAASKWEVGIHTLGFIVWRQSGDRIIFYDHIFRTQSEAQAVADRWNKTEALQKEKNNETNSSRNTGTTAVGQQTV